MKVCVVRLEVSAHFALRNVVGGRRARPCLLEHGVAHDLANLLLRGRVLVVTLLARLICEKHHIDHLAKEFFAAFGSLVTHSVELVHVLKAGYEIAETDRSIPAPRQYLGRPIEPESAPPSPAPLP